MESVTMNAVIKASRDFGAALSKCKEVKSLKQANEAIYKNKEARNLLAEFQRWQRLSQMQILRGTGLTPEQAEELKNIELKVNSNPIVQNLVASTRAFQETMQDLNAEISGLLGIDFSANSRTGGGGCC
ncbi:MAG: YlbF family regulator [Smithella sp.]